MAKIFPTSRASLLLWLMALFAMVGCSERIDIPETSNPNSMEHAPTIVTDAQHLLEQKGGFYLLNMALRDGQHTEKSKANAISSKKLKVRWDKYHIFNDRGEEVVAIPIEGYTLTALSVLSKDGRSKKTKNKVTSKLIVRRGENNKLVAVIGTYIYDQNYARDYRAELDTLGYNFENTHFTGYFITSRLDGQMLFGRNLKKGQEDFAFRLNSHPKKTDEDLPIHLHLGLNTQTYMTRSAFAEQENGDSEKCDGCYREKSECRCVKVIYCKKCDRQKKNGMCNCDKERCTKCNFLAKECNCCRTCNEPKPYCRCNAYDVNGPDNNKENPNGGSDSGFYGNSNSSGQGGHPGGGSYSGGGGFGIGGSSGNNQHKPNPNPGQHTAYLIPSSVMISKADATVSLMISKHGKEKAVCNLGVQNHFQTTFPGQHPPGMDGRANEMVSTWRINPRFWVRIQGKDLRETLQMVKERVNAGLYVVAGWENKIPNKSGHVVVVLPGEGKPSKRWGAEMPKVMDTGQDKRGTHYFLDNSFGPDKIPNIEFYYYTNERS